MKRGVVVDATASPAAMSPRFTLRHELIISICMLLESSAHGFGDARDAEHGQAQCILYEYRTKTMDVCQSRPYLRTPHIRGRVAEVVRKGTGEKGLFRERHIGRDFGRQQHPANGKRAWMHVDIDGQVAQTSRISTTAE